MKALQSVRAWAPVAVMAAALIALCAAVVALPAFPVDETRYLTVAWEMRTTGSWILPTLNFEPYSHKPPLLFWLINAGWSLFGVAVWPARLAGALSMVCVLLSVNSLDRRLAPGAEPGQPAASVLMLLSLPLFVTLGFSIMFDMLLTATVSAAMLALWIAGRSGARSAFVLYGICVGLGVLAKGPVALLFTLPAALLARHWADPAVRRGWILRIALALSLGLGLALAWALSAAYLGGHDYAEMLFWKQSAGRVTSSFAHARPFWFYVPIIVLYFVPLLLWRPVWAGLRQRFGANSEAFVFLTCWIVPGFAALSLVSGKQLHYLLPLVPAVALLASLGLRGAALGLSTADRLPLLILVGLASCGLAAVILAPSWLIPNNSSLVFVISQLKLPLVLLVGALVMGALTLVGRSLEASLMGLAAANLIFLSGLALQSRTAIGQLFDLQPVADIVQEFGKRPIAVAQETRGEFGFLARLKRPVQHVPEDRIACWLAAHPDGIAIVRTRIRAEGAKRDSGSTTALLERKYRDAEMISVLAHESALIAPGQFPDTCTTKNYEENEGRRAEHGAMFSGAGVFK